MIEYHRYDATFSDKSLVAESGRHYDEILMKLEAGDILYVCLRSDAFAGSLSVCDSSDSNQLQPTDDGARFPNSGSTLSTIFKAMAADVVHIVVTTKDEEQTGEYTLEIAHYRPQADKVTDDSPFCDKLHYLLLHSRTNFVFLRGEEYDDGYLKTYDVSLQLFDSCTSELLAAGVDAYISSLDFGNDLQAASTRFDQLVQEIASCLPGFFKKVVSAESKDETLRQYFVQGVEFELSGQHEWDMNEGHLLTNKKNTIVLKVGKSHEGRYSVDMSTA